MGPVCLAAHISPRCGDACPLAGIELAFASLWRKSRRSGGMAYAPVSKTGSRKGMGVRVPPSAVSINQARSGCHGGSLEDGQKRDQTGNTQQNRRNDLASSLAPSPKSVAPFNGVNHRLPLVRIAFFDDLDTNAPLFPLSPVNVAFPDRGQQQILFLIDYAVYLAL